MRDIEAILKGYLEGIKTDVEQIRLNQRNSVSTSRDFHGSIDEVRISNVARSDDWIMAEFLSMSDLFITYGMEIALTESDCNDGIDDDGDGDIDCADPDCCCAQAPIRNWFLTGDDLSLSKWIKIYLH